MNRNTVHPYDHYQSKLDDLSLRRNKPPQGGGINPCPHILGIHNCEDTDHTIDSRNTRMHLSTKLSLCREVPALVGKGVEEAMLELTDAYAQKLLERTHRCRNQHLGVPPKAMMRTHGFLWCVRIGSSKGLLGFAAIFSFLSSSSATSAPNSAC
ncbi:hypothetical protein PIB30_010365 [Stylosanthes scabra]|uniref:Uncharacterized protein n=1 Tax=Stylosanthes scabra TaxID=79078 RepID=A0ABU6W4Y5_9FABA|nr:hypothetical protein [Stylosanthes scabra]